MNITILTVDTDYTRTLLNTKLEEQNHTVIAGTNNYEEALSLYKTYLPDIIILDIDLGSTNKGLSFINELLDIDPSAQVIALSTFFQDTTKARLLKKGIDRLVMKPYQPAHIWEQIDNICETNNILGLREARENLISDSSFPSHTYNKGKQLNNQILSLRDQISRSRNLQENKDDKFNLDSNSDTDDFILDFNPTEKTDKDYTSYSLNISKTNMSDKSQDIGISLYDTQEEVSTYNSDHPTLYRDFSNKIHKVQENEYNLKSYLGLPVFIDRENVFNPNDSKEVYDRLQNSTNETSKETLLQRLLKKKGGK